MPEPQKTQPWKAHWPAPTSVEKGVEVGKKAGERLEIDGSSGNGAYGYNDKGEGVAPAMGENLRRY